MTINLSGKVSSGGTPPFFSDQISTKQYVTGQYYPPSMGYSGTVSYATTANRLYYVPFVPMATHTFTAICALNQATGDAGDRFRLGIYSSTNYLPDSLILDAGEITLDASLALREITISQTLTINTIYWLAMLTESVTSMTSAWCTEPSVKGYRSAPNSSFGLTSVQVGSGGTTAWGTYLEAYVYSTLPTTATPVDVAITAQSNPLIYLKA